MSRFSSGIARKHAMPSDGGTRCLGENWCWKWWTLTWKKSNEPYKSVKSKYPFALWRPASLALSWNGVSDSFSRVHSADSKWISSSIRIQEFTKRPAGVFALRTNYGSFDRINRQIECRLNLE